MGDSCGGERRQRKYEFLLLLTKYEMRSAKEVGAEGRPPKRAKERDGKGKEHTPTESHKHSHTQTVTLANSKNRNSPPGTP